MSKTFRLPIFRAFTHPKLEAVGFRNGTATAKDLAAMSNTTNALIDKGLHEPPLRQTHNGAPDGTSRGWVRRTEVEGNTLYGLCEFTELAQRQVKAGELRWFSSGIRRDFSITGEPSGPKLPGAYIDHVAMLGDEHPQVKGLIDLSTVEFKEGEEAPLPDTVYIGVNETTGEVNYFAEAAIEEDAQMAEPSKDAIALFMERSEALLAQNNTLTAQLAAEKMTREALEAKIKEGEKTTEAAKFADFEAKVITPAIESAGKALKLGADDLKHWKVIANRCYGDREAEAAFTEVIKGLTPKVPTKRIGEPATGTNVANLSDMEEAQHTGPGSAEFGEGNKDLTAANFAEAITNPAMSVRIGKVLNHVRTVRKITKPEEFTFNHLWNEYKQKG